jgi:hypothetical protein
MTELKVRVLVVASRKRSTPAKNNIQSTLREGHFICAEY